MITADVEVIKKGRAVVNVTIDSEINTEELVEEAAIAKYNNTPDKDKEIIYSTEIKISYTHNKNSQYYSLLLKDSNGNYGSYSFKGRDMMAFTSKQIDLLLDIMNLSPGSYLIQSIPPSALQLYSFF